MPCIPVRLDDGAVALMCTRGRAPRKPCVSCGAPSTRLCDFVLDIPAGKTCDAALCARCTQRIGKSEDRCPKHRVSRLAPTGCSASLASLRQGQLEF
jgi:hypothetical protein